MRAVVVLLSLLALGCHDGNGVFDPCMTDTDADQGCGNDKPAGSLDCDERPPCNVEETADGA